MQRVKRRQSPPHPVNSEKIQLQTKAAELREQGLSFPQIARLLNVSVGTAWNLVYKKA